MALIGPPFSWASRLSRSETNANCTDRGTVRAHLEYMKEVQGLYEPDEAKHPNIHWFDSRGNYVVDHSPPAFLEFIANEHPKAHETDYWIDLILRENMIPSLVRHKRFSASSDTSIRFQVQGCSFEDLVAQIKAHQSSGIQQPETPLTSLDEAQGLLTLVRRNYQKELQVIIPTFNSGFSGDFLKGYLLNLPLRPTRLLEELRASFESIDRYGTDGPLFVRNLERVRRWEWNQLREDDLLTFIEALVSGQFMSGPVSPVLVAKAAVAIRYSNHLWLEQTALKHRLETIVRDALPLRTLELQ